MFRLDKSSNHIAKLPAMEKAFGTEIEGLRRIAKARFGKNAASEVNGGEPNA